MATKDKGDKETDKVELTPEQITELQKEVETLKSKHSDLNQGIAKYRDDAQDKTKQVEELQKQITERDDKIKAAAAAEGIDPKDTKVFEKWAKKKGFVTKEELDELKTTQFTETQKNIQLSAVNDFLGAHPEYNDDKKWKEIQEQFSLYKIPSTVNGYKTLLEKIHKGLGGTDAETKAGDKVRAKLSKKARLSLGGGSQKTGDKTEEIENLQKIYPNLSKEQIEQQLETIDSFYPEKKKE